jgi:hypothetical protein
MKRSVILSLGCLVAAWAQAEDLEVRNVALVRAGHLVNIVATVRNTNDHPVESALLIFSVVDQNHVIAKEAVQVPPLEAGQAWRVSKPVRPSSQAKVAQAEAQAAEGRNVTIDARMFPKIAVQH